MGSAGSDRRVLIVIENLPAPFDRRVWQEARTLRDAGYRVTILCPKMKGYDQSHEVLEDIHIYRHPLPLEARGALGYLLEYATALFWEGLLMWRIHFRHGFDVIHACNPPDLIFLNAVIFKWLFGVRFLFDHHDINPELFEVKFGNRGILYRLILLAERLTFRCADVSIATNESYREIAIRRGRMPADKVFVVRSGPDLRRLVQTPAVPSLRNERTFLVGYVGVMGKQEGLTYLLEAARIIVQEHRREDVQFALVGGGPELEYLQSVSVALGLADYVTFTGRAPDSELLDVLNTADVCVNPDEHNPMNDKSTMNKIMEYMALGKPIVQFDLTEGRVSAQEASLYAKPNDARDLAEKILELLDEPERRRQMGLFGRRRVEEELAWPHEIPKLLAAYEALWA